MTLVRFGREKIMIRIFSFLVIGSLAAVASADEALDNAWATLKTYEWGSDRAPLEPIEKAVNDTFGDAAARLELQQRLIAVLQSDAPRAAKDFVCRKLSEIGSATSVPALAELLNNEQLSHMARYALERIPDEAAVVALRDALPAVADLEKVGVINSLGVRRDEQCAAELIRLLKAENKQVAAAATQALGKIGNAQAAEALDQFQTDAPEVLRLAAADAYLNCAEQLLADGNKLAAMKIYRQLSKRDDLKHIQLAARRGLLAALGQP
jgi:HEAT repeat protein